MRKILYLFTKFTFLSIPEIEKKYGLSDEELFIEVLMEVIQKLKIYTE